MPDRRPIRPPQPTPQPRPLPTTQPITGRPSGSVGEPTTAFSFDLTLDRQPLALARISGLELAADLSTLEPLREPRSDVVTGFRARPLQGRLLLARAVDGDRALYGWRREALSGRPALKDLTIRQLDRTGTVALNTWRVQGAWPLRWAGPSFDALVEAIAFEELELVFVDLEWL